MSYFTTLRPTESSQTVAYTGTAGTSSAIGDQTEEVRLVASTDCFVTVNSVTATTANGFFLPADTPEYVHVTRGSTISAIQDAAGGNLYITEMTR